MNVPTYSQVHCLRKIRNFIGKRPRQTFQQKPVKAYYFGFSPMTPPKRLGMYYGRAGPKVYTKKRGWSFPLACPTQLPFPASLTRLKSASLSRNDRLLLFLTLPHANCALASFSAAATPMIGSISMRTSSIFLASLSIALSCFLVSLMFSTIPQDN